MITDTEIRVKGMEALSEAMGLVEAERFISLIQREPFDYTKWRKNLIQNMSLEEISTQAMQSLQAEKQNKSDHVTD